MIDTNTRGHGWLAIGSTATFDGNVTAPKFIGDLQGNADSATTITGSGFDLNTSGIVTCGLLHATNTGAYDGAYVGYGLSVVGSAWVSNNFRVEGTSTTLNTTLTANGTTITGTLDVNGKAEIDNIDINGNTITTANTNGNLTLSANGSGIIAVSKGMTVNGNTTITGQLDVTGNIRAFTSDIRLKTDIEPITDALSKVDSLNGFTYNHNEVAAALGFDTETRYAGVSAQEVEKVLPEVVSPAPVDENYKTVQYEHIVPLLIEAIKELKAEVEELKKHKH